MTIYQDLIKPLHRLKPGVNVDPTSGPHNRTLCDSAFFRFDGKRWKFFNSALPSLASVKGITVPEEWKEMSAAEQFAERISGLYEWDRHIGIPSAAIWDQGWDGDVLFGDVAVLPQVVLSVNTHMAREWVRLTDQPPIPPYEEVDDETKGRYPTEADWVLSHYKKAARKLAASPFTALEMLESPDLAWLWEHPEYGFACKASFVSARENGHTEIPRYFPHWREMLTFDRLPIPTRRDIPHGEWVWETVVCGTRDDGTPVWLQDEESGLLDLVIDWHKNEGINIVALSAPKGMGKTNFTRKLRDELAARAMVESDDLDAGCVFRAFFHRVSLVRDAASRYGVDHYQSVEDLTHADSLCSTYQSLHKLGHREVIRLKQQNNIYVLSLDEVLAGFVTAYGPETSEEDGIKNLGTIWEKLKYNVALADLIVVSDADLPAWCVEVIYLMREEVQKEFGDRIEIKPPRVGWVTVADRRPKEMMQVQFFSGRESPLPVYLESLIEQGKTFLVVGDTRETLKQYWEHCHLFVDGRTSCPDPHSNRDLGPVPKLGLGDATDFKPRFLLLTGHTRDRSECSALLGDINAYLAVRKPQGVFASPVLESGVSYEGNHFDEVICLSQSPHSTAQASSQQGARARLTQKVTWFVKVGGGPQHTVSRHEVLNGLLNLQELTDLVRKYEEDISSNDSRWTARRRVDRLREFSRQAYDIVDDRYVVSDEMVGIEAYAVSQVQTHLHRQQRDRVDALLEQWEWDCQPWSEVDLVSEEDATEQKQLEETRKRDQENTALVLALSGRPVLSANDAMLLRQRVREGKVPNAEMPAALGDLVAFNYATLKLDVNTATQWDVRHAASRSFEEDIEWRGLVLDSIGAEKEKGVIDRALFAFGHTVTEAGVAKKVKVMKIARLARFAPALQLMVDNRFDVSCTERFVEMCLETDVGEVRTLLKRNRKSLDRPPHKVAGYILFAIWEIRCEWVEDRERKQVKGAWQLCPYPNFLPCSRWIDPRREEVV